MEETVGISTATGTILVESGPPLVQEGESEVVSLENTVPVNGETTKVVSTVLIYGGVIRSLPYPYCAFAIFSASLRGRVEDGDLFAAAVWEG